MVSCSIGASSSCSSSASSLSSPERVVIFIEITDRMIDRNEAKWYILNLAIEEKFQWHDVIGKMNLRFLPSRE